MLARNKIVCAVALCATLVLAPIGPAALAAPDALAGQPAGEPAGQPGAAQAAELACDSHRVHLTLNPPATIAGGNVQFITEGRLVCKSAKYPTIKGGWLESTITASVQVPLGVTGRGAFNIRWDNGKVSKTTSNIRVSLTEFRITGNVTDGEFDGAAVTSTGNLNYVPSVASLPLALASIGYGRGTIHLKIDEK